jgi:protein TonB
MASGVCLKIASLALAAGVAACGSLTAPWPAQEADESARAADQPAEKCQRGARATIDSYKIGVAQHILRSNLGHTIDDQLPPMLPAIVVLRLSIDRFGKLTDLAVQRTRDATAAAEAVASIRRSGTFPLPCGLIVRAARPLTFYETFLFNTQYQFQLRTLAGKQ